jgi:predicted alpha/beta-hydrolase family hydrolase
MAVNTGDRGTVLSLKQTPFPVADFVFAHGAGAGKDSAFIQNMAARLEDGGVKVHLFNFDYMAQALIQKKRRPPSKMPILCDNFIDELNDVDQKRLSPRPLFIGGKSMGSRVACEIAEQVSQSISGIIAYGYPFHPAKKPERSRLDTLTALKCPCLVVQGESDALGSQSEVEAFDIPNNIVIEFVPTANHDLKPLKRSGWTEEQALQFTAEKTLDFIRCR